MTWKKKDNSQPNQPAMVEGVGGEVGGGGRWECSEAPERLAVKAGEREKEGEFMVWWGWEKTSYWRLVEDRNAGIIVVVADGEKRRERGG